MEGYNNLVFRLDAFIRKYYTNKLIRGVMVSIAALLALYLVMSVGEYNFYFSTTVRYVIDGVFLVIAGFALIAWIILPALQILKLGKVISREKAASIIGTHFPDVQDKLLNVLNLKQQTNDQHSNALLLASIDQKTKELQPIPFQRAVDLTKNKKYLKYLLPPIAILLMLLMVWPTLLTEATSRLIQPSKKFVPKAPFVFQVSNKNLTVAQYEDFEVVATTKGNTIPDKMYLIANGHQYDMVKQGANTFKYKFTKVPRNQEFNLSAAGFSSEVYKLKVLMRPAISNFKVYVDYPDYTGNKDEVLDNMGDIVAPAGTNVKWVFSTTNTDKVLFQFGEQHSTVSIPKNGEVFSYGTRFMHDTSYSILVRNNQVSNGDSLHYNANIIPDQFPAINVTQYNDSTTGDYVLFVGEASDDYGVNKLNLNYTISRVDDNNKQVAAPRKGSIPLAITGKTFTQFNHMFDIAQLALLPGTKLNYYFEVWDNDGVNGSKSARSQEFTYEKPTIKQMDSIFEETQQEISKDLSAGSKQSEQLQKKSKELQEKILEKENLNWEDKKQVQDLLQEQKQMMQNIEEIKEKFQKNNQNETKEFSEELQQRQDDIEKIMDEMLTEEMKQKLDKLQDLMDKLSKEQMFQELQKLEENQELQKKDFERLQSLMNDLERDLKMEDLANQMRYMAKLQDKLQKENDGNLKNADELKKEQDDLNKKFDESKKDFEEIEKLNDKSERPTDMDDLKQNEKEADDNMKKSSDDLKKDNKKSASPKQKKAKEKLEELSKQLKEAAEGADADELEIDIKATRQLLTNLVRLSFAQEKLIEEVRTTPANNPQYVGNVQVQQKLRDDSKMIADSLFQLSKRIASLSSLVNKEVEGVNRNMSKAIERLEQRYIGEATANQQYVMTGANNLALMLNELLQQLMDKQANESEQPSSGSCSKPGGKKKKKGSKPGSGQSGEQLGDMISQQQKLGGALQQLLAKKSGKQGKQPGDSGKDGKEGKEGEGGDKPGQGKDGKGQGQEGKEGKGEGGKDGKEGKGEGGKDGKGEGGKEGKGGQNGSGGGGSGSGGEGDQQMEEAKELAKMAAQQAALRKQLNDLTQQLTKEGKSVSGKLKEIQQDMDRNETDLVNRRITQELVRRQSTIVTRMLEAKDAMRMQDQGEERQSNAGKEPNKEVPASLQKILKDKQSAIDYYKTVPPDLKPYYKQLVEQYFGTINLK
jgi:hypothetical protein